MLLLLPLLHVGLVLLLPTRSHQYHYMLLPLIITIINFQQEHDKFLYTSLNGEIHDSKTLT